MDVVSVLMIMLNGIWLFIPAMVPNSAAALFGGGPTIDGGRKFRGRRIFGNGKTWKGFFAGALVGIVTGIILIDIAYFFDPKDFWGYGPFWSNLGIVVCLSFGAVLGDLMGAFIKRRLGLKRGEKAPILDQYDFVFGAFLVTAIFFPGWVYSTYFDGWNIAALLFLLLIMFAIHRLANIIGYKWGVKKEPW
ncbi:MAG: CDP-2,3-bis-(O-geranylgeranyl)-sn-glycerol synthase [Candidatus Methanomethylophilaceae archaeon]|jgi:CDP-2,3-bis-(O-geranylgeranyl)-sn-glycerol synthase